MKERFVWLRRTGMVLGMIFLLAGCGKGDSAYQEGMKLAGEGKYEKALSQFQQAVKEDGEAAQYHIGYGMAYNYLGKYSEAQKVFQNAMDKLKDSASKEEKKQFYYGYAVALSGEGEYGQAASYCDRALKISLLGDMDSDINYTKAVCLENQGKYEEAQKICERLVKDNKKDWQAYYELARLQEKLGKTEDAVKTYQKLTEEEQGDGSAHFALYNIYQSMGKTEEAEDVLGAVLRWDTKKASNALAVGRAYYYKGDREAARDFLQQAYDENCTEGLYYLGVLSMEEQKYQEGEKHFLAYIKEAGENLNAEVYNQLAVAMMEQGKYKKAQSYLTQGMDCGMTDADQGLRKNQVILYEKQKKYEDALEQAQEYVKRYPADAGMKKELIFIRSRIQ